MIEIKSPQDIKIMRKAGKIAAKAMAEIVGNIKPGITTLELDAIADKVIVENGAFPAFKKVKDYYHATCININAGIVHGLPSDYELQSGDVVSIDLGAYIDGFYSDMSTSVEVETSKEQTFLETGKRALAKAISKCIAGTHLGDVSHAIQSVIEAQGYSVSTELVGHGIGRELHEKPQVFCYGREGTGPVLREGMVLAVEVLYQKGKPELTLADDLWTLITLDNSLSGLFEHTVAITKHGPETLTVL